MPPDDAEDLNVMSLSETKSQRAPTSETPPDAISEKAPRMRWLKAAFVGGLGLAAIAFMFKMRQRIPFLKGYHGNDATP